MKKSVILLLVLIVVLISIINISNVSATTQCQVECELEYYGKGRCISGACSGDLAEINVCDSPLKCCCYNPLCVEQRECWEHNNQKCFFYKSVWMWGTPFTLEFNCDDGWDNDCDGDVDLNDEDCAVQTWSCNTENYQCYRDEYGQYGSETSCQVECIEPTACSIVGASIVPSCTGYNNACIDGDEIELNVQVGKLTDCADVDKIEIKATSSGQSQPLGGGGTVTCDVSLINLGPIITNVDTFTGNWVVSISDDCEGATVNAFGALLYASNEVIAGKSGDFGSFTFAGAFPGPYKLAIDTCIDSTSPPDGECEESINGEVFVNDYLWGLAPQSKNVALGQYLVSFGSLFPPYYSPADILVSLPPEVSIMGVYTIEEVDYALIKIKAINQEGESIGAIITLLDEYGVVLEENPDEIEYKYEDGIYPVEFIIEFGEVTNYIAPSTSTIEITGEGIYSFTYIYVYSEEEPCECSDGTVCGQCQTSNPYKYCDDEGNLVDCNVMDCCPANYICSEGICEISASQEDCHDTQSQYIEICNNIDPFGSCYWDKPELPTPFCKHCLSEGPTYCGDYDNGPITCNLDPCNIKADPNQCLSGYDDCKCEWNSITEICEFKYTITGPGANECCDCSVSYGDCEDGCNNHPINYREKITDCEPCTQDDVCNIEDKTECQPCGLLFRPLPFFSWFNVLIVMSLLIVFYVIFRKKFNLS